MASTTVPHTMGGKNLRILPMNMPMKIETNAATSWAPKIAAIPYCMPIVVRMGMYANATPMTLGSPMPNPSTGNSCTSVVSPPMIIADCMSMVWSAAERPQVPAMSMGGVMLPTSMARTCCMACGNASPNDGLPSSLKSAPFSSVETCSVIQDSFLCNSPTSRV